MMEQESNRISSTIPQTADAAQTRSQRLHLAPSKVADKYFTPTEVEEHNSPDDCWLSWLGLVYNLTKLVESHRGDPMIVPILRNAGKDISHWFDRKTGELKSHINPLTGCELPYTPEGRFLHVPPPLPRSDWKSTEGVQPWWLNKEEYCIGYLSQKTRKIQIMNMLTKDTHTIEVCSEEKLSAIQERYMNYNAHAKGYMWKRLGQLLDMTMTLEENGIKDESIYFEKLGIDEDKWLPVIHLYFR